MGSSGPTNSTVTQSNLPEYAKPFYESLMKRAEAESKTKYQPYGGERLAGKSQATQKGLSMAAEFGRSQTGIPMAISEIKDVGNAAGSDKYTNYQKSGYDYMQLGFGKNGLGTVGADRVGFGGQLGKVGTTEFDSAAAQKYMSPYMDAVVNRAQANAVDNYQQQLAARNLQAAKAGSFGGSRAAVQNAIAERGLQSDLTDIMVQGQQSAFENAQSQFNTDRARALQAATQNQNTALSFLQGNQQANLQAATQNQNTALAFNRANQDAKFQQAQLRENSRQFGANLGLEALGLQRQAGLDQAALRKQQDDAIMQRMKAQLGVGQTYEDYEQQRLDQRYNDFVNQRDSERQNLQFLSSILQGVPISPNSDITTSGSSNNLAGIIGALGGMKSLNSLGT